MMHCLMLMTIKTLINIFKLHACFKSYTVNNSKKKKQFAKAESKMLTHSLIDDITRFSLLKA